MVYPMLVMVGVLVLIAAIATHDWGRLGTAVLSAIGWFTVFWTINFVSPRLLGFGDVRFAGLLGLGLGWLGFGYVFIAFFAANVIGMIIVLGLMVAKRVDRNTPVPYGVFLVIGAFFALFVGMPIVSRYSVM